MLYPALFGLLHIGKWTLRGLSRQEKRASYARAKVLSSDYKKTRKVLRYGRRKHLDAFKKQEGPTYASGEFYETDTTDTAGDHGDLEDAPPAKKLRKAPCCKTCGRPKKRHPRGLCVKAMDEG